METFLYLLKIMDGEYVFPEQRIFDEVWDHYRSMYELLRHKFTQTDELVYAYLKKCQHTGNTALDMRVFVAIAEHYYDLCGDSPVSDTADKWERAEHMVFDYMYVLADGFTYIYGDDDKPGQYNDDSPFLPVDEEDCYRIAAEDTAEGYPDLWEDDDWRFHEYLQDIEPD